MYMWLVLSTFLAILAGYALPIRSDIAEKKEVPVAAAHIMKMAIKHRIAKKYVESYTWPNYCGSPAYDPYAHSDSEGEGTSPSKPEECDEASRIGYVGSPDNDNTDVYEYKGFFDRVEDSVSSTFINVETSGETSYETIAVDSAYTSQILCYNDSESGEGTEESVAQTEDCSNAAYRYLITYGNLDQKWLVYEDSTLVKPRDDIMKGFAVHFAQDEPVGYVVRDENSIKIINYFGMEFALDKIPASRINNTNCASGKCIMYFSKL